MTQTSLFSNPDTGAYKWSPERRAGLQRISEFVPNAGRHYASQRNTDPGENKRNHVSLLSPWLRYRLVSETELLTSVLARHTYQASEKFIQEVFWRGYFKGWLAHRPDVWQRYRVGVTGCIKHLDNDSGLKRDYEMAVSGNTGIDCFDYWANELVATGYLHNHARMWFASIWIFTLKLPWELGADFFFRHLIDGDPASNTCSWRWVAGLHTVGKTYLARADNIERFTNGRFNPAGQLSPIAPPLPAEALSITPLPAAKPVTCPEEPYGLLITEEHCAPAILRLAAAPATILGLTSPTQRSLLPLGEHVSDFTTQAVKNAVQTGSDAFGLKGETSDNEDWAAALCDWCLAHKLETVLVVRPAIGPVLRRLDAAEAAAKQNDITFIYLDIAYDQMVWPKAQRGFFGLKKKIPEILQQLGLI